MSGEQPVGQGGARADGPRPDGLRLPDGPDPAGGPDRTRGPVLTGGQVGVLLTLAAEGRPLPNPELAARFRRSLDGADRRLLNGLGLVTSRRAGRHYVHELTDAGWARCRAELAAAPVARRGAIPPGALHAVLAALDRYLDHTGLALADLFSPALSSPATTATTGPAGPAGPVEHPVLAGPARTAMPAAGHADPGGDEVERRIRAVYGRLARWPGDWVRLADLRPRLGADVARADVDAVLRRMNRGRGVTVAPDEDQKALTGADRRDAVEIGGQAQHLIMVEG